MIRTHRVGDRQLAALARGPADRSTLGLLRNGQVSKRLLLLRLLLDTARSSRLDEHFAVLSEIQHRAPTVVAELLHEPHLGAWLAASLRRLRGVRPAPHPVGADLGYLGALAAAAAIRAGIDCDLDLPARDGTLMLPSLGRASVGGATRVAVRHRGGVTRIGPVSFTDPRAAAPGWAPLRSLHAEVDGLEIRLRLDDLDPFRDCHQLAAAERLSGPAADRWARLLAAAWRELVRHHRPYAEALAAGLRTVVPLRAGSASLGVNVTSMDAFGAVSLTEPSDGRGLALGLLHEFQHAKLGALIDMVPLYARDETPRYYAAWRDDPRPLGALLQGAYAFQAVTDFWRVQRNLLRGGAGQAAHAEFVRWRDRVWRTMPVLESSGRFTATGVRFLSGMRSTQRGWQAESAPAVAVELAREAAEDHWVGWRLRNRRPDPAAVARLAQAWRQAGPPPAGGVLTRTRPGTTRLLARSARLDLVRLRITRPDRFAALCADPAAVSGVAPGATVADLALARRDYAVARRAYTAALAENPDELDAWIGLALACQRGPGGTPLRFPELCRAVYRAVGSPRPDPVELSEWLAPVDPVDGDRPATGAGREGAGAALPAAGVSDAAAR